MAASTALQVFVSPLLGVVFQNLGSLIQKEIVLVLGVKKDLVKLSDILSTIQDVLEDAEVKQIDEKPINKWLSKLKDLAYEADDILDECATEDIVRNNNCNNQVTSPSNSSYFDFKGIMFRRSIGKRIKKLLEKFNEMAELRSKFHLNLTPKLVESGRKEQRETSSTLTEPHVYGRKEEKEHIANLLLEGGEEVSVCCIVGMGGLGKTTLAQSLYNDENITKHFEVRCWVCVSDHFVLKTLLKSIIESTGGNARDLEDLEPLERRVQGILSGKKFLLVLDDVWNEDQTKWNKLKLLLTRGGTGSSIIVTTRLESVASLTSSTRQILHLQYLSEEDCWSLFKNYAFDGENKEYHQKFEKIGKEIVKKCRGVPLAAKALGGLLHFKKTESEWSFVKDSALWDLPQDKERDILPALSLSYNHLSSPLKQCFSYCSIFPKDHRMEKEDLIHLWMANGFIQSKGNMGLEDIGNEIFNELLWRSFFQETMKDKYGDIMNCKMHDLMHDLACSITMNECTTMEANKDKNKSSIRHLSLEFLSEFSNLWLSKSQPLLLRTLFQTREWGGWHSIQGLTFTNLKCLRVLDLSNTNIYTLHVSIGNLKHLRYLDLSDCRRLRSLLDQPICSLRNLQVLKLDDCGSLRVLPKNIRKMTNLRHLGLKGCDELRRMPVGMGNLSCLRTLNKFIVAPETGHGITELQGLDHLTGELEIKGLEHVRNSKDANLMRKNNLRVLKLFWSEENNGNIEVGEEGVTRIGEGLQPHPNIKKLQLKCYNGLKFPSWMMSHSCLPNLVAISLVGCRRCEHLPPLGSLPLLEILVIRGMDSVKCIGDEFYGDHQPEGSFFPTLKYLLIDEMLNLEEWYAPSSTEEEENKRVRRIEGGGGGELPVFPSLECLTLGGCPKLRTLPTTLSYSLKELTLSDCNEMLLILESSSLGSLPPNSSSCLNSLVNEMGCLQSLVISYCDKIETLPKVLLENLPSTLTRLRINDCKELVCLPEEMQNLTSLKSFDISYCRRLKYLPELVCLPEEMQNLTSLESFDILECPNFSRIGSRNNNTALTSLSIEHCSGLTSVSDCLRHLTTLEDLWIDGCPELEFLPDDFQDLTSLRVLYIHDLPQMTCLPEGLQQVAGTLEDLRIFSCSGLTSLPEWMDKFTSLRKLNIRNCHPDLHRRYAKETGEDWHKIAHIPDLSIEHESTQSDIGGGGKRSMKCNMIPCFSSSSSSSSGTN